MRVGFVKTLTAGALIGAAAGMMFMPELDRKTKRRLRRTAMAVKDAAGDAFGEMKDWMG